MSRARRDNWLFGLCVGVLVATVVTMQIVRSPEPLGVDQGLFACFARWIPRGALPYRDLFDSRPPLYLYWWAASAMVPGDVVHAAWRWEGLWLAATLGVAFALGRSVGDRWVGLVAAALLFIGLWSPAWGDQGQPLWSRAQAEEVLALPMLVSAWLAWRAIDRERLALGAGLLVGICGLFEIASMVIALAWIIGWLTTTPGRAAGRRIARLALGALSPWGLAFAWFAAHGAITPLVDGVFVYPVHLAAFTTPPWGGVLQQFATTMVTQAPLLVVAAALGVFRMARRGAREVHWAAAWIVATAAGVIAQRPLAGYHCMLVIPALAVVGAIGVVEVARLLQEKASRALAVAALGGLALFAADEGRVWRSAYAPDAACLTGRLERPDYLRAIAPGSVSLQSEEQAAQWVRDSTSPGDGILVWAQSPGLYALADRHPVTRYPLHKILLTDAPLSRSWPGLDRRRAEFLDRFRKDPPALVLVAQNDANGFEPLDSYGSLGRFRELRAILQREYEAGPPVGRFLSFRLVPPAP